VQGTRPVACHAPLFAMPSTPWKACRAASARRTRRPPSGGVCRSRTRTMTLCTMRGKAWGGVRCVCCPPGRVVLSVAAGPYATRPHKHAPPGAGEYGRIPRGMHTPFTGGGIGPCHAHARATNTRRRAGACTTRAQPCQPPRRKHNNAEDCLAARTVGPVRVRIIAIRVLIIAIRVLISAIRVLIIAHTVGARRSRMLLGLRHRVAEGARALCAALCAAPPAAPIRMDGSAARSGRGNAERSFARLRALAAVRTLSTLRSPYTRQAPRSCCARG